MRWMFLLLIMLLLSGCAIGIVGPKTEPNSDHPVFIQANPQQTPVRLSEPSTGNTVDLEIDWSYSTISLEEPSWTRYRTLDFDFANNIVVSGRLSNGKMYPVWIDSGMVSWPILINDLTAVEQHFGIPNNSFSHSRVGTLPLLEIGGLKIRDSVYLYIPYHWEFQVLGFPIWQDKRIVLGLETMARFRYIHFDNPKKRLQFSHKNSFCPEDADKWEQFRLDIEWVGYPNRRRLMVNMPIAGRTHRMEFDTGGLDLAVDSHLWHDLQKRLKTTEPKPKKFISYKYGNLECQEVVAQQLPVGNIIVERARIQILPENSPYLVTNDPGQIGMGCFRHTEVVLDFENKLLWLKSNVEDQRPQRSGPLALQADFKL